MTGFIAPDFSAMPMELRNIHRWVVWKGRKVPYCATAYNSMASSTNQDTWSTFHQAQAAYEEGGYLGVGFVLSGDGIVGVDLDKCVQDGTPEPAAMQLLERIGCQYIEYSPSGQGLHGLGRGDNSVGRRGTLNGINVELYSSKRYLTVTGKSLAAGPLVSLAGFAAVAGELAPPTEENGGAQRNTEDGFSHPPFSSVLLCRSGGHDYLPKHEGERNRCLFELARRVKGACPNATKLELRAIVVEWHAQALPFIATKDFAITLADFMRGWEKVKHPHGQTLQSVLAGVDHASPLPTGIAELGYGDTTYRLIRICAALQSHHGSEPFFLSARQAGKLIGVHFTDAAKLLQALVFDGVLTLVSRGAGKVASRYRFTWTG